MMNGQINFIHQDSVITQSNDCTGGILMCIDSLDYDNIDSLRFFLNGSPFATNFSICKTDTVYAYSYFYLKDQPKPFTLQSWDLNGVKHTINFSNLTTLRDSMRKWDAPTNWRVDTSAYLIYFSSLAQRNYNPQVITSNAGTNIYTSKINSGQYFHGLRFRVNPGFHRLVIERKRDNQRDTVILGAACVMPSTIRRTLTVDSSSSFCADISQLLGQSSSIINFCTKTTPHVQFTKPVDNCIVYKALSAGNDTACLKFCDRFGVCDTTTLIITAIPTNKTSVNIRLTDSVMVDSTKTRCDVQLPDGKITSFTNVCDPGIVQNVSFKLDTVNYCVSFKGLAVGSNNICIRACNSAVCDTTFLTVFANKKTIISTRHELSDTITQNTTRKKILPDLVPSGMVTRFENLCTGKSGRYVQFTLDNVFNSVFYQGIKPGKDTACILTCNTQGVCDTTYFYITTLSKDTTSIPVVTHRYSFLDTVTIGGAIKSKCDIHTPANAKKIENYCSSLNTGHVKFDVDTLLKCVTYSGLVAGSDSACIRVCDVSGVCDTTIFRVVSKLNIILPPTPSGHSDTVKIKIAQYKTYCPDTTKLAGSIVSSVALCQLVSPDNVTFKFDTTTKCIQLQGIKAGVDTFCIVIKNKAGFNDTTQLYVFVSADTVKPYTTFDTLRIFTGDSTRYCKFDSSGIKGKITKIFNNCPAQAGLSSQITLDTVTNCLSVRGLFSGTDKACVVGCNRISGLCDTTQLVIIISPKIPTGGTGVTIIDSVKIKILEQKTYCSDTSKYKTLTFCALTQYKSIGLDINPLTKCVVVTGKKVGRDTLCTIACKVGGVCDTFKLYATVTADTILPQPRTDIVNIQIGKDSLYCNVDTSQIRGNVDTIYDACLGKNGTKARMVLDRSTKCVAIRGVNIGSDTMCLVVCNKTSNLCDTTFIVVNVKDSTGTNPTPTVLQAYNDLDSLRRGANKDIYVYSNDSLGGKHPTKLTVILPPTKGTADTISFRDGIINYKADNSLQSCGIDSFRYRVCIDTVCSEATVTILIICRDSLFVWNALSPNGDGKNDVLVIEGLQNYPNHTLCIYNRWGNEVYKTTNYNNDWSGTWNGKGLPDGVYFYFLRDDDKQQILKTGYINLSR